ncbi:PrtR transmembrane transcriptional regulator (Anti-sigma factor) [Cupriavidus necator]|uniref:PrtR transmembrane transcriptional regulator (Anti-sigma factor) n=1 Tax=Cupriavidus necator TaxID=106590 RepID=A0A1K0J9T8_CUPNE|nr:PrtR transmembrane transcriptional regulator (Anti-sigma factor) [Cupriavidus necator]
MNPLPVSEAELHAYVDGLLPESRCAEIECYLSAHPEEAVRVRIYREQKQAIRTLFGPVLDETIPDRLIDAARMPPTATSARAQQPRWLPSRSLLRVAASVAIALIGAAAGWLGRGAIQQAPLMAQAPDARPMPAADTASLPRRAAIAHVVYSPDVKRPVELEADQEDQLVAWLSRRLGAQVKPPKLGSVGYELIGGRLLPGASGPVAQFMYHDVTGQRLTLYVTNENAANKDTGFRFAQEGPVNVFYWIDGKFGYALSAGIDRGELARVATAVYAQLQSR